MGTDVESPVNEVTLFVQGEGKGKVVSEETWGHDLVRGRESGGLGHNFRS